MRLSDAERCGGRRIVVQEVHEFFQLMYLLLQILEFTQSVNEAVEGHRIVRDLRQVLGLSAQQSGLQEAGFAISKAGHKHGPLLLVVLSGWTSTRRFGQHRTETSRFV